MNIFLEIIPLFNIRSVRLSNVWSLAPWMSKCMHFVSITLQPYTTSWVTLTKIPHTCTHISMCTMHMCCLCFAHIPCICAMHMLHAKIWPYVQNMCILHTMQDVYICSMMCAVGTHTAYELITACVCAAYMQCEHILNSSCLYAAYISPKASSTCAACKNALLLKFFF